MSDSPPRLKQALDSATTMAAVVAAAAVAFAGYFAGLAKFLIERGIGPAWAEALALGLVVLLGAGCLSLVMRRVFHGSRLLRPEAFDLRATRPEDLIGRKDDIEDLAGLVADNPLVFLTGESGAGKSALVAVGLVPRLSSDGRFLPVLVSRYGNDWVEGPVRETLLAFRNAATAEERERLGLVPTHGSPSPTAETLADLFARAGGGNDRRPLLIFDQFDDYQTRHRARFLSRRRDWITAAELRSANPFWRAVGKALGEGCHALIVMRTDTTAGLHSVRLAEPVSRPLDRVTGGLLAVLLDRLAAPDATPPVVSDPEAGWTRVKAALVRDLERDGAFLPQQVRVVLQGLRRLPVLTPGRYRRAGGAQGLEALFVRDAITATSRLTGAEPAALRALLAHLVDRGGRELKTQRLPESALSEDLPDGAQRARALAELERREVVRAVPNAETGGAEWQLDHDYLARAVLAEERAANREVARLREGEEALARVAGDRRQQWQALLSPGEQAALAVARLRGRFRYGPHRTYALRSLARLAPVAAVLGGLAVGGWAGAWEWNLRATATRIVEGLQQDEERGAPAVLALWSASPKVRDRAASQILASPARLRDSGPRWTLAIAGAEPDRAASLVGSLRERLAMVEGPHERRALLAAIEAVRWRLDAAAAAREVAALRERLERVDDADKREGLHAAVDAVDVRLNPVAGDFVNVSERTAERIGQYFAAQLTPAASETFALLVDGVSPDTPVEAIRWRLAAAVAAREVAALRLRLERVDDPHERRALLAGIEAVGGRLVAAAAAREVAALRLRLERANDPHERRALLAGIEAAGRPLDAAAAAREVAALRLRLERVDDPYERRALLQAALMLVGRAVVATDQRKALAPVMLQILGDPFFEGESAREWEGDDTEPLSASRVAALFLPHEDPPSDWSGAVQRIGAKYSISPESVRAYRPKH